MAGINRKRDRKLSIKIDSALSSVYLWGGRSAMSERVTTTLSLNILSFVSYYCNPHV